MAAVAKSSPSDGRIACPQCGGLVHPIAGRCKHCKADLADARGARPAAAAALPALAGGGTPRPAVKADATPVPSKLSPVRAIAAAAAEPASILPPRETGRMPVQGKRSLLKNWPVLVIILAALAIAAAVVLMVWPPSSTAKADTRLPPPPAPERMDTDPLPPKGSMATPAPPSTGVDPWSKKPDPDDQANIDPDDPAKDPLNPRANGAMNMLGNGIMFSVFEHACTRMTSCGNSALAPFCSTLSQAFGSVPTPSCAAAQRCIERIDALPCDAAMSSQADILTMMGTLQDCSEAARC